MQMVLPSLGAGRYSASHTQWLYFFFKMGFVWVPGVVISILSKLASTGSIFVLVEPEKCS
jgi:hypothetical protein